MPKIPSGSASLGRECVWSGWVGEAMGQFEEELTYCTDLTLGFYNALSVWILWGVSAGKRVGFTLCHVPLSSHREWGRPAGTAGYTTSPSDMTVSNQLDGREGGPFRNPKLTHLHFVEDIADPGVEDFSELVQVCQQLKCHSLHSSNPSV